MKIKVTEKDGALFVRCDKTEIQTETWEGAVEEIRALLRAAERENCSVHLEGFPPLEVLEYIPWLREEVGGRNVSWCLDSSPEEEQEQEQEHIYAHGWGPYEGQDYPGPQVSSWDSHSQNCWCGGDNRNLIH